MINWHVYLVHNTMIFTWFIGHCQSSTGLAVLAGMHRPDCKRRACISLTVLCLLQGNAESAVRATVEWLLKCNAVVLPQGGVYLILHGLACTTGLLLMLSVLVFLFPHANVTGCNTVINFCITMHINL